jgi:hypothetical protein
MVAEDFAWRKEQIAWRKDISQSAECQYGYYPFANTGFVREKNDWRKSRLENAERKFALTLHCR